MAIEDDVIRNLEAWYGDIIRRAHQAMEEITAILEDYAKSHHKWKPDTGATDVSTRGFIAEVTPAVITAVLTAGMEYDIFLELAREGKWSWLWPAIEANKDVIERKLGGIRQ